MARQHGGATVIDLANIIIDDEFQARHRELTSEERQELMIQIERFGFREPLVVWQHHNILLDGHNRLDIWHLTYNGDDDHAPEVVEYAFPDREAALEWIDKNQRARRNLTSNEMAVLRGREYQETKKSVGASTGNENASKNKSDTMSELNQTSSTLAEKHGVSSRQIERDAKFAEAIDTIEANVGKEAVAEIVQSDKPPVSRKQVQQIAELPAEQQATALEQAKQKPKTKQSAAKTTKPKEPQYEEPSMVSYEASNQFRKSFRRVNPKYRSEVARQTLESLLKEDAQSW